MKSPNSEQEKTSDEESDEQDKHLSQSYDNLLYHSDKQKLIADEEYLPDDHVTCSFPKPYQEYSDSLRNQLAKYVPASPFKLNAIPKDVCDSKIFVKPTNGNKSFHLSISTEEDYDYNEHTYSKSCDCSEETMQTVHQHVPITRSVSEDFLQHPTNAYERRLSTVSSSKGRLAAVPRFHPKEKLIRTSSVGNQPPPRLPPRISHENEEELQEKSSFSKQKKYVAFCLCLVDFTAFLSMSIIAPFFPKEASDKGMREAVSGFVFSIYALIVMITSPIFGKILPFVGAKFMFLSGVGFCGTCNVLFGLLDKVNGQVEFTVLCFVVRSFEAIGAAAFCTASCTILIDQFPDHIGTVFGFIETCMGIGMSLGPAIGGALYAAGGFGLPFFTLGGFVVAVVPVCWFLLRDTEDPKVIISTNSVSYKKLLSMPHVVVVCLILAVSSQAQAFIDPTLEPHMRQYNLDASIVGVLFLLLSGCYGLASPIVGWVSQKLENKYPLMIIGLLLLTASLLLLGPSEYIPIEGSVWLSTVALALLGFSLAIAYIPTFESIFIAAMNGGLDDDINTYSVVSGLWNSVYSLGEVTGPALGGVLSDFFTFPQASTLMAFCTLAAFVVAILAWFNPSHCFGIYSLIEDAPEKMTLSQNAQVNCHVPFRECTPLQNGCVHTYGSLCEDKKDPIV